MHNVISDREHAMLMSAKRRSRARRNKWGLIVAAPILGAAIVSAIGWVARAKQGDAAYSFGDAPPSLAGLFRNSEGALCSNLLSTACVYPSGEVQIPSGSASVTVRAFIDLRPHIPGASHLTGFAAFGIDRRAIQTNRVKGMLSAADTLTVMLEGTPLAWSEIIGPAWMVGTHEGAQGHERRSL